MKKLISGVVLGLVVGAGATYSIIEPNVCVFDEDGTQRMRDIAAHAAIDIQQMKTIEEQELKIQSQEHSIKVLTEMKSCN